MSNPSQFDVPGDDAEIARALEDASIPTLLMSMIHMSGSAALLDGALRPAGCYINEYQGYMSEEHKAEVREQAMAVIREFRAGGCQLPPQPDAATIQRMMNFIVAQEVPEEYVPMMLEEMELDGQDHRSDAWGDEVPRQRREQHKVLVMGGGMSGVLAAVRLKEAGIPFVVIEKNSSVGGTWYENRYPGARVDVSNHLYCYSFEPAHHWTQYFAQQPELQKYFEGVVAKRELAEHFRLNTQVVRADYDEVHKHWRVLTRDADGNEELFEVASLISAAGQLNVPKLPDVPGIESFAGQWCHSAQWDERIDYRGKRVVVVGAGASAFQIVPTIAPEVSELTVFQRVAPWMFENPIYHDEVPEGMKWCLQHLPFYRQWFRFLLFWPACDGAYDTVKVDPAWPHQERSINEMNDFVYNMFADYIRGQVGDDEALLQKVLPDYPPMGRRTLQDNGSWLSALKQPHVNLEKQGIAEVTPAGVVAEDGSVIEADIIIYATGFQVDRFLPMPIHGLDGRELNEVWGDDPAAYLGVTVAGFPNFYCMFGPGTNLAFGGSLVFNGECQARYIMECIKLLLQSDKDALVCSESTFADYKRRFRELHAQLIWEHPAVKSYYQNADGKVTLLWPWKIIDMWRWTQRAEPTDYDLS